MKLIQVLVLVIGVITMKVNANTMTLDEAKIRSNINAFSVLADQAAFNYLGRLLAQAEQRLHARETLKISYL